MPTHRVRVESSPSRREFLSLAGLAGASALAGPVAHARGLFPQAAPAIARPAAGPWAQVDAILGRIVAPTFPTRDFLVTAFGAKADGVTDCTDAFRKAIAACASAGGGRVVVPPGKYATGPIHLKSRVNLHVGEGATLLFSTDPKQYLPAVFTRWEGVELMNYSPLIYAFDQRDIAVTGSGTLDGQASDDNWWFWKGRRGATDRTQTPARNRLFEMGAKGVPVAQRTFGEGDYLRPNFIQPYRCQNVLVEGVTILRSPMWEIHPCLCTNVTVRGVTIDSHGPNNDGCDPESCRDVLIEKCSFDTGDDCIAIKSGRNDDGRRVNVPVENVIVRDCVMKDGHGGVTIGSEISGGARNIFAERCAMDSPNLDRALRIKTNAVRGGLIEHVYMRDVKVGQVAEAVVAIDFYYEEADKGAFPPTVRDVDVRNVTSRKSQHGLLLRGFPNAPITDVRLVDCTFENVAQPDVLQSVRGLSFTNVSVNGQRRNETIER